MPGVLKVQTAPGVWEKVASSGMDQATADARYVNVAGDTMTGPLTTPQLTVNGEIFVSSTISGADCGFQGTINAYDDVHVWKDSAAAESGYYLYDGFDLKGSLTWGGTYVHINSFQGVWMNQRLTIKQDTTVPLRLLSGTSGSASIYGRDATNTINNGRLTFNDVGGVALTTEQANQPIKFLVNNLDKLIIGPDNITSPNPILCNTYAPTQADCLIRKDWADATYAPKVVLDELLVTVQELTARIAVLEGAA